MPDCDGDLDRATKHTRLIFFVLRVGGVAGGQRGQPGPSIGWHATAAHVDAAVGALAAAAATAAGAWLPTAVPPGAAAGVIAGHGSGEQGPHMHKLRRRAELT